VQPSPHKPVQKTGGDHTRAAIRQERNGTSKRDVGQSCSNCMQMVSHHVITECIMSHNAPTYLQPQLPRFHQSCDLSCDMMINVREMQTNINKKNSVLKNV
jgi:hypothetical protein